MCLHNAKSRLPRPTQVQHGQCRQDHGSQGAGRRTTAAVTLVSGALLAVVEGEFVAAVLLQASARV